MEITSITFSQDRKKIILELNNAENATSLKVWDDTSYKDYSKSIDLTSLLTGQVTESLEITPSDLGIPYFDGVYFFEIEDTSVVLSDVIADLTRYKECVLNKLRETSVCVDCPDDKKMLSIINIHAILRGVEIAVEFGFINEIILKLDTLKKFCSNDCKSCGDYDNIIDTNYYSTND